MSTIHDKIRKLLALGENTGFEGESNTAMEMAMRLMLEHGITREDLEDKTARVGHSDEVKDIEGWQELVAYAATELFGTRAVLWTHKNRDIKDLTFAGRVDNVKASLVLFDSITRQIETLYKRIKPKGMTKSQRAAYRREFKRAAAMRVWQRACAIIERVRKEEQQAATPSTGTALAIIAHRDELIAEVDEFLASGGVSKKKTIYKEVKPTGAAIDGTMAGDQVKIQETVEQRPR